MELPALAQLSNTTSTFSGQVAATCSLNLPDNIPLEYKQDRSLGGEQNMEVTANFSSPKLHIERLIILETRNPYSPNSPIDFEGRAWGVYGNTVFSLQATDESPSDTKVFSVIPNDPRSVSIGATVKSGLMANSKYTLPPGQYSFRTTITCLL